MDVSESIGSASQLNSGLRAGIDTLSLNQTVTFTLYVKLVLPLDGFVYWVNANLLTKAAIYNAMGFNTTQYNQNAIPLPETTIVAKGSLHYSTNARQDEAANYAFNRVVFTSETEIQDFYSIGPTLLYIGSFQDIRFAFSERQSFYEQAGIYHYVGDAIFSSMDTQILDSLVGFDLTGQVVSNSLPLWLALNFYDQIPGFPLPQEIHLYPSYAVPENLVPPYGVIHIEPESTEALQSAPFLDKTYGHTQLCKETVKITLYGERNLSAANFVDFVFQYSMNYGTIGIMNMPIVRDEKETQVEMNTLAMRKTVIFEINYNQYAMRDLARQLIIEAIMAYTVS